MALMPQASSKAQMMMALFFIVIPIDWLLYIVVLPACQCDLTFAFFPWEDLVLEDLVLVALLLEALLLEVLLLLEEALFVVVELDPSSSASKAKAFDWLISFPVT